MSTPRAEHDAPLGHVEGTDGFYTVRRAVAGDVPALVALLASDPVAAARGEGPDPAPGRDDPGPDDPGPDGAGPDNADGLATYRQAFAEVDADPTESLVCLVAPDGEVVGTLQLGVVPGLARRGTRRAQVEAVRVAASHTGRGLGTGLLRWAIAEARRRGCGLVQLTTDATRLDAHRFYARLGFEHTHHGLKMRLDDEPGSVAGDDDADTGTGLEDGPGPDVDGHDAGAGAP